MRPHLIALAVAATVGFIASPSIAYGSYAGHVDSSPSGQSSDRPHTVKDALSDRTYLASFSNVDLTAADSNTPILDTRQSVGARDASSAVTIQAAAACSWTAFTNLLGTYGPVSRGCGIAGSPGYNKPYRWTYGTAASICSQGVGYNSLNKATWYYTGCAGGVRTVPWGNNLAQSQFHVVGPALNLFAVPWQD